MTLPVVCIQECKNIPDMIVLCSGTRAEIYKGESPPICFNKSKDPVFSVAIRSDGRLIALGTSAGEIMIFDADSKLHLRTLVGHKQVVRSLKFLPNKLNLISSSDDCTVKIWDIASATEVCSFNESMDYVRTIDSCSSNQFIFAAGSSVLLPPACAFHDDCH